MIVKRKEENHKVTIIKNTKWVLKGIIYLWKNRMTMMCIRMY